MRRGQQVIAMLDAANHDPAVFESPGTLDVTRDAHQHMAFGAGAHYSLGAALARAEAQVELAALVALRSATERSSDCGDAGSEALPGPIGACETLTPLSIPPVGGRYRAGSLWQ